MKLERIGMLGYGEVGKIFSAGLKDKALSLCAWDLKFNAADSRMQELEYAASAGTRICTSMEALCGQSDLIISAVTASNTLTVAQDAAQYIGPGTIFLDLNSASPATKQHAAKLIDAVGGHYVEAGVMTSVPPFGIRVPMLLGGAHAPELAAILADLGMNAKVVADEIGVASAIKMCRSIMIKGLEALVIESYTTARKYGIEDHMIPTLQETFPSIDWEAQGSYFFSRVARHGKRRAEEMRECANTVREAGFEPVMAAAIAEKHEWVANQKSAGVFDGLPDTATWRHYADRLLQL